jgi:hypothetical protein
MRMTSCEFAALVPPTETNVWGRKIFHCAADLCADVRDFREIANSVGRSMAQPSWLDGNAVGHTAYRP